MNLKRPGRSKGCEQCRKRRVKCDETPDFCRQCLRLGLDCSGPIQGVTIIDMTQKASGSLSSRKSQQESRPKKERNTCQASQALSEEPERVSRGESDDILANFPTVLTTEKPFVQENNDKDEAFKFFELSQSSHLYHHPSNVEANEQFLLGQLIQFSRPRALHGFPQSWIGRLPEFMSASQLPALRCSIRAATTAFHGLVHKDVSAMTESCRWYIKGLNRHRNHLVAFQLPSSTDVVQEKPIPGIEEVIIPVFLCLFEVFSCTTTAACFQHLAAAVQIIVMRGPENCKDGLAQHMFRSIRLSDACISIFSGKPSVFASHSWQTIPFLEIEKPPLHRLVDIMLSIPLCLGLSGQHAPLLQQITNLATSSTRETGLGERTLQLLEEVKGWWAEYKNRRLTRGTNAAAEHRLPYKAEDEQPSFVFSDTLTALTVSIYNATTVILRTILHVISLRDSPASFTPEDLADKSHLKDMLSHCTSILQISAFHENQSLVTFDIMREAFPLKIVAIMSPDLEQRAKAQAMIRKWNGLGLSGILRSDVGS